MKAALPSLRLLPCAQRTPRVRSHGGDLCEMPGLYSVALTFSPKLAAYCMTRQYVELRSHRLVALHVIAKQVTGSARALARAKGRDGNGPNIDSSRRTLSVRDEDAVQFSLHRTKQSVRFAGTRIRSPTLVSIARVPVPRSVNFDLDF